MTGKWGKLFTQRPVLLYVFIETNRQTDLLQSGDISIMFMPFAEDSAAVLDLISFHSTEY